MLGAIIQTEPVFHVCGTLAIFTRVRTTSLLPPARTNFGKDAIFICAVATNVQFKGAVGSDAAHILTVFLWKILRLSIDSSMDILNRVIEHFHLFESK